MKLNSSSLRKLGWLCFKLLWIPFFTMFIGMWDFPNGTYDFSELPQLAKFSIIAIGILSSLVGFFFFGSVFISIRTKKKLLKNGIKAPAKITRIYETGTTVNNSYLVGFELEVIPKNAPKFNSKVEQLMSRLNIHKYSEGDNVLVAFNPENHNVTIISKLKGELLP